MRSLLLFYTVNLLIIMGPPCTWWFGLLVTRLVKWTKLLYVTGGQYSKY